jgi:uncharacterized membrane protein YgcG
MFNSGTAVFVLLGAPEKSRTPRTAELPGEEVSMKYRLRDVFPILVVLAFASSCLADAVTTTSHRAGANTAINNHAYPYYSSCIGGSRALTPLSSDTDGNSIDFGRHWQANPNPRLRGMYLTGNHGFTNIPNNFLSLENDNPANWTFFDGGKDNSTLTAADRTIINEARDSSREYRLLAYCRGGGGGGWGGNGGWSGSNGSGGGGSWGESGGWGGHEPSPPGCPYPPPPQSQPSPVPEAGTFLMVGSGLLMLAGLLRGRL